MEGFRCQDIFRLENVSSSRDLLWFLYVDAMTDFADVSLPDIPPRAVPNDPKLSLERVFTLPTTIRRCSPFPPNCVTLRQPSFPIDHPLGLRNMNMRGLSAMIWPCSSHFLMPYA